MKIARWKFWAFATILAATYSAVAQSPTATPTSVDFGSVEIGITSQPRSVTITNPGDTAVDLKIALGSPDFSETHDNCPKSLPPKQSCEIMVRFIPKTGSTPAQPTKSVMEFSGSSSPTVALSGVGVPNFKMSPEQLAFGNQLVNTSSAPRVITVTNNTGKALSNIDFVVSGEFTETHSACQTLNAGASCAISVVFTPKHADSVTGALTVSVKPGDSIINPKVVSLSGEGVQQCNPIGISWGWGTWTVVVVCGFYFLCLVLVRWHMIAKPARLQLRAQILAVRARVDAETSALPACAEVAKRKEQINGLLNWALFPIKTKHDVMPSSIPAVLPGHSRLFNALFWTRGHELAGWSLAHEAEEQLVALLPLERVRARMETAEQQLRQINTAPALAMADRLRDAVKSDDIILQEKLRALLTQATTVLQQTDAPQAAQQTLLANSMQKTSTFLNDFVGWVQTATATAAADLADCQTRLTQFQQRFANWSALNQEIGQFLAQWPAMPQPKQDMLRSVATFLAGPFAAAYQGAGGSQTNLNSCNSALATVTGLQTTAQPLATQLTTLVQTGQDVDAFKDFLQKSKPQTDLLSSISHSLDPLRAADLLQQISGILDADHTLDQQVIAAGSAASTDDVTKFRSVLTTFAFSLPLAQGLTSKIKCELDRQLPSVYERWRSLLMEALSQIYDRSDTDFSQLANWHNKLMWLVGCAMLFILALALTFQNASLLLLGAVGGLLSRLGRNLQAADVENDYGASWGALFLSPVTGALSAWGGILLIILGNKLNILGAALNFDWCNTYDPMTLAVALLFGFSERLFDNVVSQVETKFLKAPPATPGTSATSGSLQPKITPADPLKAPAGKPTLLTIRGQNFQSGATATFLDKSGTPQPADVVFKDSTTLTVTVNPPTSDTYKSTLTVINPDKQSATADLTITGSA